MRTRFQTLALSALLPMAGATLAQGATVFSAGFEYTTAPTVNTNAANIDIGMTGLVGTFSGTLPTARSDSAGAGTSQLVTFPAGTVNTANHALLLDRPTASGTLTANLTGAVALASTTVSFDIGSRRLAAAGQPTGKDYDIIGLDASGNEAFHLRVLAGPTSPSGERLAAVTGGGTLTSDLATTSGSDAFGDLPAVGNPDKMASISLSLQATGYVIQFSNPNVSNSYTTDLIAYNGSATTLSKIEFQFDGSTVALDSFANQSSGFYLDNLVVTAVPTPAALPAGLALLGVTTLRRRGRAGSV